MHSTLGDLLSSPCLFATGLFGLNQIKLNDCIIDDAGENMHVKIAGTTFVNKHAIEKTNDTVLDKSFPTVIGYSDVEYVLDQSLEFDNTNETWLNSDKLICYYELNSASSLLWMSFENLHMTPEKTCVQNIIIKWVPQNGKIRYGPEHIAFSNVTVTDGKFSGKMQSRRWPMHIPTEQFEIKLRKALQINDIKYDFTKLGDTIFDTDYAKLVYMEVINEFM